MSPADAEGSRAHSARQARTAPPSPSSSAWRVSTHASTPPPRAARERARAMEATCSTGRISSTARASTRWRRGQIPAQRRAKAPARARGGVSDGEPTLARDGVVRVVRSEGAAGRPRPRLARATPRTTTPSCLSSAAEDVSSTRECADSRRGTEAGRAAVEAGWEGEASAARGRARGGAWCTARRSLSRGRSSSNSSENSGGRRGARGGEPGQRAKRARRSARRSARGNHVILPARVTR